MNKTVLLALTSALALGSAALANGLLGGGGAPASASAPASCQPISALVAADPNFSTLGAALNAANLTATLAGPGPFTVFAPTNAAFAKLPTADLQALVNDTATLTKVLQYHVVSGRVTAAQAMKLSSAGTLVGSAVAISMPSAGVLRINDATVIKADVAACNGVIHAIDTVLLPPGVPLPSASATDTATTEAATTDATTEAAPAETATTDAATTDTTTDTAATTDTALPATISVASIPARPLSGGTATATDTTATATTTDEATEAAPAATDTTTTDTTATTDTATTDATAATTDTAATDTTATTDATATTDTTAAPATTAAVQANSISKVAAADPRLSSFVAALKAANLETAFDSPGDYTVFAPTNEAFAKIPKAQLDALLADPEALFDVLNYHVLPGRFPAAQVATLQNPQTLEGDSLTVAAGADGATVNGAMLVAADVQASNGVVHLIDTVLLPPNFQLPAPASTDATAAPATTDATAAAPAATATTTATATTNNPATGTQTIAAIVSTDPNFSTLNSALQAAGLTDLLSGSGPFTVFAPSNAAFAKIPAADLTALLADKERLTKVLQYHVVQGVQSASAIAGQSSLATAAGVTLPVTQDGNAGSSNFRVGGALVTQADVAASNGVIHVIDTVLMPQ